MLFAPAAAKSEKPELFGLFLILRKFHGRLFGEVKQRMNAGGLPGFFKRFDNPREKKSAIDAVFFGAVKRAVRKSKMADEGAEFIVEHAGEDDAGQRTAVEHDAFRRAGAVLFNGRQQKFKIERRVVSDQWKFAAKIGKFRENGFDSGPAGNHIVSNAVNGRGFRRNRATGVDERAESSDRFGITETHRADFNNGIRFRLNAGGFKIERNKVHTVSYTVTEECAQGLARFYWTGMLAAEKGGIMKTAGILGALVLAAAVLCGCSQKAAAADQAGIWKPDYDAALKQAAAENKYVLVSISGLQWCGWCKALENEVFSKPEFIGYARTNLVCVLLDFSRSGRATNTEFAKQHEELLQRYQVEGFPTVLILSPQGKVVKRDGYQPGGAAKYVEFIKGVITANAVK